MAATDKTLRYRLPKQKVPLKKKNQEWKEDTIDAFIEKSTFARNKSHYRELKVLYDYYNGHMHRDDYKHVLKPYGGPSRKNVPADLKRYNIIKPVLDVLIGEKARRPDNAQVIAVNADTHTEREQAKVNMLIETMMNRFYEKVQEKTGLDAGQAPSDTSIEEKIEFFDRNYKDIRSELGQHAWNYVKHYCEIYHNNQKMFKDFLIAGEEYAYNGDNNNDPEQRVLNPLDIDYDKDPELDFVEDGDWAIVRRMMTASSIVTEWHSKLTSKEVDRLEDPQFNRESFLTFSSAEVDEEDWENDRLIEVFEVYWKSYKKIGFLTYIDEDTGLPEMRNVDEFYEPSEEESVEWLWIPEVWEGVRIDGDIYKNVQSVSNQRRSLDNPAKCKLPINGRKYSNRNSANISLLMMGIPYQLIYDIYHYRLELSIAKSKDVIAEFDVSHIPTDWDVTKFMTMLETTGVAFMDYNQEGKKINPHAKKALDLSIKTIEQYIALLDSVKLEWEGASGVPRQRQGNIDSYDGKGVTEQSIIQSSYITEDHFRKHAQFEERNATALIDISQNTWVAGKKGTYLMPDGTQEFFNLTPGMYSNAQFGIFFSSARKDIENVDVMKQLSHSFAQNGARISTIATILESDNFSEIKRKIEQAERLEDEREQAIAEAQEEAAALENESKQMELQAQDQQNMRDNQTRLEEALINAESRREVEAMKITADTSKHREDVSLDRQSLSEEERSNRVQEALKRIELQVKKKQASKPKK